MTPADLFLVQTVGNATLWLFCVLIVCLLGSAAVEDLRR